MRNTILWLITLIVAVSASPAQASYLTSDYEETPRQAPPRRIAPPPPAPQNPMTDLVRRVRVRAPYHYRGLTVFLLEMDGPTDGTGYLSTQEALAAGMLAVQEKGSGSVPSLQVENTGKRPVLMLGGELLLGGKQNRVLREDVLLPPESGPVEVPVLCIERGRWTRHSAQFESKRSVAPLTVRGSAQAGRSQDEIWEGVAGYQRTLNVDSATQDLQAIHDSEEVRKALADYRDHVQRHCWRDDTVGMVVARYGRVVGADLFCNAALFRKHRNRLLDSYALDCIAHGVPREDHELRIVVPSVLAARHFLERAFRADYSWKPGPGAGRLLSAGGAGVTGSALVYGDVALHACLFPQEVIIVRPPHPEPPPRPIPVPRPME